MKEIGGDDALALTLSKLYSSQSSIASACVARALGLGLCVSAAQEESSCKCHVSLRELNSLLSLKRFKRKTGRSTCDYKGCPKTSVNMCTLFSQNFCSISL